MTNILQELLTQLGYSDKYSDLQPMLRDYIRLELANESIMDESEDFKELIRQAHDIA